MKKSSRPDQPGRLNCKGRGVVLHKDITVGPDAAAIRRDLEYMMAGWDSLGQPVMMEMRAFKEGAQAQSGRFVPSWIDEAVQWACEMNRTGRNIYVVRNPIRADYKGHATDADIVAAFFLWADCDDPAAAGNIHRFDGPKWSAAVTTGRTPSIRVHTYWRLTEPCRDLTAWRRMQEQIALHFGSDRTVVNPSRIMRVGGTVAYPDTKKQAKGYISEVTTIRTEYDDARAPVTLEQMARVFSTGTPAPLLAAHITAPAPSAATSTSAAFDILPPPLDRDRAIIHALAGVEWHNAVIRLVASYVARGLSDAEIHALTDPLTLAGYTVEQTRNEVQTAIDGARRKGFSPTTPLNTAHQFREMDEEARAAMPAALFRPWRTMDLSVIPAPDFLYANFYARGYTSLTVAMPKAGKSMLGMAEAIDMATGRGILTGHQRDPLRVVYYNAEDDQATIDSRVAAILTLYGIGQDEIAGRFYPTSGINMPDFYMVAGQEGAINEPVFASIENFIKENGADVLIFDPLQDMSRSPETNEVFRLLGQRLRRMASELGVAIGLIHHTRKLAPGMSATIDDARGGSALRGTARFNRVLALMTEDEAVKAGIETHRNHFRIADVESNLAPPSADINKWFERISVPTPNGHNVGAVKSWKWPDAFVGITADDARRVQMAFAALQMDPPREDAQSKRWAGIEVARVLGLDADDKAVRARIKTLIKTWISPGVLGTVEVQDTRNGRTARAVVAGNNNPATENKA